MHIDEISFSCFRDFMLVHSIDYFEKIRPLLSAQILFPNSTNLFSCLFDMPTANTHGENFQNRKKWIVLKTFLDQSFVSSRNVLNSAQIIILKIVNTLASLNKA